MAEGQDTLSEREQLLLSVKYLGYLLDNEPLDRDNEKLMSGLARVRATLGRLAATNLDPDDSNRS